VRNTVQVLYDVVSLELGFGLGDINQYPASDSMVVRAWPLPEISGH